MYTRVLSNISIIFLFLSCYGANSASAGSSARLPEDSRESTNDETSNQNLKSSETQSRPEGTDDVYMQYLPHIKSNSLPTTPEWYMVGANPQRTSWTPEEVSGFMHVEWYREIEAYIPQNVQIITHKGMLYISTADGLLALDALNGNLVWRFDTEMPLGNSPTIAGNVVYVAGYDRKLYALNVYDGTLYWSFDGAFAGYDTNPLVAEGKVILGNRDGYMYAIGEHGTPEQGQMIWRYKTDGPIHLSAAYKNGVVYFASDDNFAYAIRVGDGTLVWKSQQMPGDGFHSYWPVIYKDKVIFSGAIGYRVGAGPGTMSLGQDSYHYIERDDLFPNEPDGVVLGPEVPGQAWANGNPVIDASRISQYLEEDPTPDANRHKPWRRVLIVLNQSDGSEFTFDSDGDGFQEHVPVAYWGTQSGGIYPPLVGPDGILYVTNIYLKQFISQGRVMGWNLETPSYLSLTRLGGAVDEPISISAGGNLIYRNLCCDREGNYLDIRAASDRTGILWSYNLDSLAPAYDEMWKIVPGWPRLLGWYVGNSNSINSAYHNHGIQNPLIPYNGKIYVHRSNAIIAYGKGPVIGQLPIINKNNVVGTAKTLSRDELVVKLEEEVGKIINAGPLRPGYINNDQFSVYGEFIDYFENPGDTLFTLAKAYPYLSTILQDQLRLYLHEEFQNYFDPVMYGTIGWAVGAPREWMPLPPEVQADLVNYPSTQRGNPLFSWYYPQQNFYAMWLYAKIFPEDASRIYELAKSKLEVPVPARATADWFQERPYEHNGYIAGYVGFLNLQELAGKSYQDQAIRQQVTDELSRLLQLKITIFNKDSYWGPDNFRYKKLLDIARNFIYLVPELGEFMNQNMLATVQAAIDEYEYIAPYWYVARYEAVIGEGAISNLYNYYALFHAKALILKEPWYEIVKYLDVPGFARGDLFFLQNLILLLDASS